MPVFVEAFVIVAVAVLGLIWGSYLNVVVHRLPRGLSTAVPASHCPRCSSRIRPSQNVPVFSWLLLGARCRDCGGAISARYPLVEAAVAGLFLLGFHRFAEPLAVFVSWVMAWLLLALALIDWECRLVPIVLTLPFGVAAWALQPHLGWTEPLDAVMTSALAIAAALLLSSAWGRLRGARARLDPALGLGDAYALFLVAAFFGFEATLRTVLVALVGAVVVLAASWLRSNFSGRYGRRRPALERLPLVTFLALAALWVLLIAPEGPGVVVRPGL